MRKQIVTVNFNTQELTDNCIRTLHSVSPDCDIFVFDNSDRTPYENTFDYVQLIDNTGGNIIDLDGYVNNFTGKTDEGKSNNWGSAKHAMTIDVLMKLFSDGFLLCDSDITAHKDVSGLFDDSYAFVGEISDEYHRLGTCVTLNGMYKAVAPRVLPMLCYINSKMCANTGIRYFNSDFIYGFDHSIYDTGAFFLRECLMRNLPFRNILISDYITHLGGGSHLFN